jgi:hypothetical protein
VTVVLEVIAALVIVAMAMAGWPALVLSVLVIWARGGYPWPPPAGMVAMAVAAGVVEAGLAYAGRGADVRAYRDLGWDMAALMAVGVTLGPRPGGLMWLGTLGADAARRAPVARRELRRVLILRALRAGAVVLLFVLWGRW